MGLYFGTSKRKLLLDGVFRNLMLYMDDPIKISLMSSDEFYLQDLNGLTLIAGDYLLPDTALTTLDYYTLIDLNGRYLTVEEV